MKILLSRIVLPALCGLALLVAGCQSATVAPEAAPGPGAAAPGGAGRMTGVDVGEFPPMVDGSGAIETAPLLMPPGVTPVKVGLLLPLTGRGSDVGQALLDAALLALHDMGEDRLVLLPRDTGGTASGARAAAADVLEQGAQLILGPLLREDVAAAAPLAREAGVNVIAFSSDRSVAGDGVYLISFTPEQEVERVVGYAMTQGLRRFAALIPLSIYGSTVGRALEEAALRLGGEIVAIESYLADGSDANQAVKRLAQRGGRGLDAEEAAEAGELPPLLYDAVLLPEGGQVLRIVAPLLPYYDIGPSELRVLGTGLWAEPDLGSEPALVGGWYAAPPPGPGAAFAKRFEDIYGWRPPRLASLGYDAMALAAALAGGNGSPDYSRDALTNARGFAGADGIFRFQPNGVAERGLAVLEVQPNGVEVIAPAPQSFERLTE